MDTVCNTCDGVSFTVNAGFYYCDNCGERATVLQEIEDDAEDHFDDIGKKTHRIKQVANAQSSELTTWETYNYIIYGFVNELICLGCKENLMLTSLQLWSAYLRKNEIAFYGKRDTNIPKFPFKFSQRDVRLIYSLPIKKRRHSSSGASSAGSALTLKSSKRALARKRKSLVNTQYEEYMSSQKTDITSIGLNLSQRSSTGQSSETSVSDIRIAYSRRTRLKARKKMSRNHLNEHENDIGRKLKCHDYKDKEVLGRSFVYALLWLALNQVEDSMQIGDLIRYAKESHVKLNNVSNFLPPNIDSKHAVNHFRKSSNDSLTHAALRAKAYSIARIIRIRDLKMPDLCSLSARYVRDLCLPSQFADLIDNLLAFHPPEMKMKNSGSLSRAVPNFEGRAMAYVIFVLKLVFGVDDKREHEISATTQVVNDKLNENDSKHSSLFVWTEWVEYIKMRNVILSQCHYPTAMQIDPNAKMHTDMYVDFLKQANDDNQCEERYRKYEMDNIRLIFDQIVQLHEQNSDNQRRKPSCHFSPSLTPFYSYMEHINSDRSIKSRIYVPEFMSVNHETRDIMAFLKPKPLQKLFRTYKSELRINEIGFNATMKFSYVTFDNVKENWNAQFQFDVTREQWLKTMKKHHEKQQQSNTENDIENDKQIRQTISDHLMKLQQRQRETEANKSNSTSNANTATSAAGAVESISTISISSFRDAAEHQSIFAAHHDPFSESDVSANQFSFEEEEKEIIDDITLTEPRRNLDEQPNMLNYVSSDDSDVDLDHDTSELYENSIEFTISNFDYWIAMKNIYYLTNGTFKESTAELPKSFQWLLQQCALQIHMNPKDLYVELLAIENQYRYILKPIFKMKNFIKLRNLSNNKLDVQTFNAARLLKKIW